MKTAALITLVILAAALMGCSTDPCNDACCGELNANCCGWEFYKPCHKINSPCASELTQCPTQVVLKGCETMDAAAEEAPAVEQPAVDSDPIQADPVEPVADYGLPPASR